jgi:anthranilate synthase component 2
MLLLIDNYDSFTYNLVHYLGELGAETVVRRNDSVSADEALAMHPDAIVLSPGPCDPDRAGICLELVEKAIGVVPILGVCLGHQTIGQVFGGRIIRARAPMHGKPSAIHHQGTGLFQDLPDRFTAVRYHSLVVDPDRIPDDLIVTAKTDDGIIMGLAHRKHPIYGVQFHPESIDTEFGHRLLENFLDLSRKWRHAA